MQVGRQVGTNLSMWLCKGIKYQVLSTRITHLYLDLPKCRPADKPSRCSRQVGTYMGQNIHYKKVQVGKDQEKAQSEKDSHSKNRGGKKPNKQSGTYTMKTFRKPNEQLFSQ